MPEESREIVNGSQLPQYIGKKVSIMGVVNNVNSNGLIFDLKTTDDVLIKINMKKPYRNILEGYVEVHGIAQNKSIICDEIIHFSDQSTELDNTSYNILSKFLISIPDLWKTARD